MSEQAPQNGRRKPRKKKPTKRPKPIKLKEGKRKSLTKHELRDRRWEVQRLRLQGLALKDIAEKLEIPFRTAWNDLRVMQNENHGSIEVVEQQAVLAETLAKFDNVEQTAWDEYRKTDLTPGQRLRALDMVRVTINDRLKALMDVGLVHRKEPESTVTHKHQLDWSQEMQTAVAQVLLQQSLTTPLLEPIPEADILDIEDFETVTENDDDDFPEEH